MLKKDFEWLENVEKDKKPARLPVVFTKQEVNRILHQLDGTTRLMARLLYGAGLRGNDGAACDIYLNHGEALWGTEKEIILLSSTPSPHLPSLVEPRLCRANHT